MARSTTTAADAAPTSIPRSTVPPGALHVISALDTGNEWVARATCIFVNAGPDPWASFVFMRRVPEVGQIYWSANLRQVFMIMRAKQAFGLTSIAIVLCWGQDPRAQSEDPNVWAAVIEHYSQTDRARSQRFRLVIAAETTGSAQMSLGRFEREGTSEIPPSLIRELRERNAVSQDVRGLRLPSNAVLVPGVRRLIMQTTASGGETPDWLPFVKSYPGSELLQFAAPAYDTAGQRALAYFWVGLGPEGVQGWLYILEKRGSEWKVTWLDSPWIA